MEKIYSCVTTSFKGHDIYSFAIAIKDLIPIYYVAARGVNAEPGAVQRILNKTRISGIRDYVLSGNTFVNSFVLNWTDREHLPVINNDKITLQLFERQAQILDGQHRLAGIEEAIKVKPEIGDQIVLVSLCNNLDTINAAEIFLNINSEQKPVPKSLIYDLFGITSADRDCAIVRAKDIVDLLDKSEESPYYHLVKYPGMARNKVGFIDMSNMINAMKAHLDVNGSFARCNIKEINFQIKIIINFFNAIQDSNPTLWRKNSNPFLKAAGFGGAFDFLCDRLLQPCLDAHNFSKSKMAELMKIDKLDYSQLENYKEINGRNAKKYVANFFNSAFVSEINLLEGNYEF